MNNSTPTHSTKIYDGRKKKQSRNWRDYEQDVDGPITPETTSNDEKNDNGNEDENGHDKEAKNLPDLLLMKYRRAKNNRNQNNGSEII